MHYSSGLVPRLAAALSFFTVPTMVQAQVQPNGAGVSAVIRERVDSTTSIARRPARVPVFDSTGAKSHRTLIKGGIVGGVLGGLGAAAYALNASASNCVTIAPPCAPRSHTGRVVGSAFLGVTVGAAAGVWLGHALASRRD